MVYEREGGLPQVRIIDIDAGMSHRVAFPEPVYNVRRHSNPEWNSRDRPLHLHLAGYARVRHRL